VPTLGPAGREHEHVVDDVARASRSAGNTFFVTVTTFGAWTVSGPGSVAFARIVTVTPDEALRAR